MTGGKTIVWIAAALALAGAGAWVVSSVLGQRERERRAEELLVEGERLFGEGEAAGKGGRDRFVQALHRAEEAQRLDADGARALRLLARAHRALGNRVQAAECFDLYLEKESDDAEALREAASAYEERWELSRDPDHKVQADAYRRRLAELQPEAPPGR